MINSNMESDRTKESDIFENLINQRIKIKNLIYLTDKMIVQRNIYHGYDS